MNSGDSCQLNNSGNFQESGDVCDSCYSDGYGDSGASGNSCDDI